MAAALAVGHGPCLLLANANTQLKATGSLRSTAVQSYFAQTASPSSQNGTRGSRIRFQGVRNSTGSAIICGRDVVENAVHGELVVNSLEFDEDSVVEDSLLPGRAVGATAAVAVALLSAAGAAVAADDVVGEVVGEVVASGTEAVDDALASGTIPALFIAATVGLVVLTAGVIYLSVQEWLEKRALEAESKAVAQQKKERKGKEVVKSSRAGPKGFGAKRSKDDSEE